MQQLIQTHPKRGMDLHYGIAYARGETIEGKVQAICLIDDYLGCGSQFWIANLCMCVDGFGFLAVAVV